MWIREEKSAWSERWRRRDVEENGEPSRLRRGSRVGLRAHQPEHMSRFHWLRRFEKKNTINKTVHFIKKNKFDGHCLIEFVFNRKAKDFHAHT